jgi:DNA-binding IclR family transcriptional regulator
MKNKLIGKTLQILEIIAASPEPRSLKSISVESGVTSGTLSRIVADLCEYGLIEKFGYHQVRPSIGMIRLGQDAMTNFSLPRIVPPLLRAHAESVEAKGAFAGVHHGKLVYLYNSGGRAAGGPLGLPYWEPLLRSRLAAVILGTRYSDDELNALISSQFSADSDAHINFFLDNCHSVRKNGYLAYRELGRGWSVNFPVSCNGQVYGVSLFGQDADQCNLERMIFETSLLASRLTSALDERSHR